MEGDSATQLWHLATDRESERKTGIDCSRAVGKVIRVLKSGHDKSLVVRQMTRTQKRRFAGCASYGCCTQDICSEKVQGKRLQRANEIM